MTDSKPQGFYGNLTPAQDAALTEISSPQLLNPKFEEAGLKGDDVVIWNVSLNVVDKPDRKQSVVFLKFLRARNFVVQDALTMLINCLKWRKEFGVASIMQEHFPKTLEDGGMVYGKDLQGCPVTYNSYGHMNFNEVLGAEDGKGLERFLRWRVQLQEKAIAQLDFENGIEQIMQIHDYEGANVFEMDSKVKEASSKVINLFQDNYPETLSAKLFLNVPWFMEMLFGIMSSFSDAKTRKKFSMVGVGNTRGALLEHIAPDQIPPKYGGFEAIDPAAIANMQSGTLCVSASAPEEVTVEVGNGTEVVWNFMTKKGQACVEVRVVPPDGPAAAVEAAGEATAVTGEHGGGRVKAPAGGRAVLKVQNKEKGMLWVQDLDVLYMVRVLA